MTAMNDIALFIVGFLIFATAFVGSLCYAYALLTAKYDLDRREQPSIDVEIVS